MISLKTLLNRKNLTSRNCLNIFIAVLFLHTVFTTMLGRVSEVFGFSTTIFTVAYLAIVWMLFVFSLKAIVLRVPRFGLIIFVVITAIIIIANLAIYPQSKEYILGGLYDGIPRFFSNCLLASALFVFVGAGVTDYNNLRGWLHVISRIGIIIALISDMISIFISGNKYYDDMAFAYAVSLFVGDLVYEFLNGKNKGDLVFLIIGVAILCLAGTRGAIVAVCVLYVLQVFFNSRRNTGRIMVMIILLLLAALLISGVFNAILGQIYDMLKSVGLPNIRIIDMFLEGSLTESSGRDKITDELYEAIKEKPYSGYGIGADRSLNNKGSYAHNLFLELMVEFGIPVSLLISLAICLILFSGFFRKNEAFRAVFIMLFSVFFIKLMFSSSYIYCRELFLMLGMALNYSSVLCRNTLESNITTPPDKRFVIG